MHREQPFFQKYKRHILVVVIILIAGPFIFWVVPGNAPNANSMEDQVLIDVGGTPVYLSAFLRGVNAAQQSRQGQEPPTMQQLQENGTIDRIMNNLIQGALFRRQAGERDFSVSNDFLQERLKKNFEDEEGNFDAVAWNDFVKNNPNQNWNALYEETQEQLNLELAYNLVTAPAARITEAEIEQDVKDAFTKLQVRFARIEPKVTPTEEQIRQNYEENPDTYRGGEQYKARYVSFSLQPSPPPVVAEIYERLDQGEDFAALANEFTEVPGAEDTGGFLDWQTPSETDLPHRIPLFELGAGEVSEPVFGSGGFYIYKVEDERTNEETGKREVLARQIFLNASLSSEEREWQRAQSEELQNLAKELGSLEEAAKQMNLELQESGFFQRTSESIENVPDTDARYVARAFSPTSEEDSEYRFAQGQINLYVGEIVETKEGEIPPLEEVRDRVEQQVINAEKRTDEYKARVQEYVDKIEEQANSLDEIASLFPELEVEIQESQPFDGKTSFVSDLFVRAEVIFDLVRDAEVGAFLGPVTNISQQTLFIELTQRDLPTEELMKSDEYQTMLEEKREQAITTAEGELSADYGQYLLVQSRDTVPIVPDEALLAQALGLNRPQEEAADMEVEIEEVIPEDAQTVEVDPSAGTAATPAPAE